MARTTKADSEAKKIRAIIAATDHDEALLIMRALNAYGASLDAVDKDFPSPEMRERASFARSLAEHYQHANNARSWVEDGE